ncbi:putative toxin-antitoxin system toxin component, PIN family [Geobacter sp.]|uniref:putative toxin-antitoxin system toxin component, PIN family n=1 Tax=Geobacter sp. TaxID=46610 RepID=UPI00261600CB|nr:putative toxin-antitoxin system toxin component, PIN family [Geobacter sp.]
MILDTNVFVSGIFFTGPPHQILKAWRDGKLKLVLSVEILEEYQRAGAALAEQFPMIDLKPILEFIMVHAEIVTVPPLPEPACVDPDDDKFIACAVTSNTRFIVSGDKHLLQISGYQGVQVLKPRQFFDQCLA